MISKSSFLADMKENSKRRLWVLAVFTLVFIVLFPTFTALVINRITSRSQWLFETYEKVRAGPQQRLSVQFRDFLIFIAEKR